MAFDRVEITDREYQEFIVGQSQAVPALLSVAGLELDTVRHHANRAGPKTKRGLQILSGGP